MNERNIVLTLLVVVIAMLGMIVAYDVKQNNRLENWTNSKQSSNWGWSDVWSTGPVKEQTPPEKLSTETPKTQITASNFQDAIKKSGEHGMPVFVFFESEWCGWCKKMKSETFPNEKVKTVLKNYILVHVNTDEERDLTKKFGVQYLPSSAVTNASQQKLMFHTGLMDAETFAKWLNNPQLYKQPKTP